ncbi:MAG: hypothetical protein OEZ22_06780 [Spirochaetia bacterium]|nr:hypothetical protein [Spirochaetia bacterium]
MENFQNLFLTILSGKPFLNFFFNFFVRRFRVGTRQKKRHTGTAASRYRPVYRFNIYINRTYLQATLLFAGDNPDCRLQTEPSSPNRAEAPVPLPKVAEGGEVEVSIATGATEADARN